MMERHERKRAMRLVQPGASADAGSPQLSAEEVARMRQQLLVTLARLREATPEQIAADPQLRAFALAGGRVAFANNCAGCHGAGGQGAQRRVHGVAADKAADLSRRAARSFSTNWAALTR